MDWAEKVKLEDIGQLDMSKFDKLRELCCEGYVNVDKDGRPVYVTSVKHLKADKIFNEYTEEEIA